MSPASLRSRFILFVAVWLATTHPLPAPVTVLPAATPNPKPKPGTTSPSKPAPKRAPVPKPANAHGVPDGTYHFHLANNSGPHGSAVENNHFVVHGNTFEWWKDTNFTPTDAGRRAGKTSNSYRCKVTGPISRRANGTLLFTLAAVQIVSSQPKDNPSARSFAASLREQQKQRDGGWSLTFVDGRLLEPSSGNTWSPRR
jgi:hypothetical protein